MTWVPAPGELYYYIILDSHAYVTSDIAIMDGFDSVMGRMTIGNCYQTRAKADGALKRLLRALSAPMLELVPD
jgi:hypothetical protein